MLWVHHTLHSSLKMGGWRDFPSLSSATVLTSARTQTRTTTARDQEAAEVGAVEEEVEELVAVDQPLEVVQQPQEEEEQLVEEQQEV